MTLAHIRDGQIVKRYHTEKGWVTLADGSKVSPPVVGYKNGHDKIVPVETETIDNSTRPETTTTHETIIEANRVVDRATISDVPNAQLRELVNRERDRRIYSSIPYAGPVLTAEFQSDQSSLESIAGAATLAGFALGAGAQPGDYFWHGGEQPFLWVTMDNSIIQIDAPTMFHIGQVAASWKTKHIFAARALKDMDPIPDPVTWAGWP